MYSLAHYGAMLEAEPRATAYVEALRRTVTPRTVVLEIGTGPGVFALLACQLGARRVFAVEPDDVIQLGRELARANGYAERVEFIQGLSTDIELPEKVDVIVSDLRGCLPLLDQHLPSIVDARRRHLAQGGILIPQRDRLWAQVVEAPEAYRKHIGPWAGELWGLDLRAGHEPVVNSWARMKKADHRPLTAAACWAVLEYERLEDPDVDGKVCLSVKEAGIGHGLVVGFETDLVDGVGFTQEPGDLYGGGFFLWPEAVPLSPGDSVTVRLRAKLQGEDYLWFWDSRILDASGALKAEFRQSTFLGMPISQESLRKVESGFVPSLNEEGEATRFVLERMAAREAPLEQIAAELAARFPRLCWDLTAAQERVRQLSRSYSR